MTNKLKVREFVYDKMFDKAAASIATECFIKSLPFTCGREDKVGLIKYAHDMYSKMNVGKMIKSALEAAVHNKDTSAEYVLSSLYDVIHTTAIETATRISDEDNFSPEDEEVLKMNAEEISDFTERKRDLEIDDVASLIKDKVISTIKEEKEAFLKAEKLKEEIREVVTKNNDNFTVESFVNNVLDPKDVRDHLSLFTRTQDMCFEALSVNKEDSDGEIPFHILSEITMESSLGSSVITDKNVDIQDIVTCLDHVTSICDNNTPEKVAESALITTLCIFTLYEVLNTYRVYTPETKYISEYILRSPQITEIRRNKFAKVIDELAKIKNAVLKATKEPCVMQKMNMYKDLSIAIKEKLIKAHEMIPDTLCAEAIAKCKDIVEFVVDYVDNIPDTSIIIKELGYYDKKTLENMTIEMHKYVTMIERNPLVKKIEFRFNGSILTNESIYPNCYIDIIGFTENNNPTINYSMQISMNKNYGNTLKDVVSLIASNYRHMYGAPKKPQHVFLTDSRVFANL